MSTQCSKRCLLFSRLFSNPKVHLSPQHITASYKIFIVTTSCQAHHKKHSLFTTGTCTRDCCRNFLERSGLIELQTLSSSFSENRRRSMILGYIFLSHHHYVRTNYSLFTSIFKFCSTITFLDN